MAKDYWFGKERDIYTEAAADKAADWALDKGTGGAYGTGKGWLEKVKGTIEKVKAACQVGAALGEPASGESGSKLFKGLMGLGATNYRSGTAR